VILVAYPIEKKLVVAVSSTALFDFSKEHAIYEEQGVDAFIKYQTEMRKVTPNIGAAFPFIKRFLHLNKKFNEQLPVEVVLLSRNHPKAGLRVMDAIKHYDLDISRASFNAGQLPYPYMAAFNAALYLSTNENEVRTAVENGHPAGFVLPGTKVEEDADTQLRVAFDFDGVIASDEAERVHEAEGLPLFHHSENENREKPLGSGPMMKLFQGLSNLQMLEKADKKSNSNEQSLRVAIVTARNAPAHERLITTLEKYNIETDELFLTGGIEKTKFLDILKPHIFFDDQLGHLTKAKENTPSVHIPFGIKNQK
jgi:5'-nucleotidase